MKHASARICLGLVTAAAALAATLGATAADANFAAYRTHVNAICRSYTPRFKRLEADMAKAKRAGNLHRYAYDFGTISWHALNARRLHLGRLKRQVPRRATNIAVT